jgi:5,10-methylenetetrahydrofolate reductase
VPFAEKLRARAWPLTLEITPPQKTLPAVLLRRASLLAGRADAINVIQRPGRQSSLEASLELAAAGFDVVWHLVTRGRPRAELAADIDRAAAGGVQAVLCIRGDHQAEDAPGAPTIREAVELACRSIPGALVGATLNQYAPREAVLRNLAPKLTAGASYVQTQPVFSLEQLEPLALAVKAASPETAIVAMAMPLLSAEAVDRVEARLGISLPKELRERLDKEGEPAGWAAFARTMQALRASRFVDGVAIMTFEMDPPASYGERLSAIVDECGTSV